MSILSTNKRLIKVGQEYSAGSGISIDEGVISVTGEFGKTYSAGDNIDIYEQDEQLYISSKDWSDDIANASSNAYEAATAQIPDPFDPSYISGQIDNKLNTTAFTAWQSGQYATDLQTIEGQITNKLDESAFSDVSASFLTAINIPESATWQDVSTTVQSNSAQWSDNTGDEEVNSFVYDNSATINDVNSSYKTYSSTFLTALPEDLVYTSDITGKLDASVYATDSAMLSAAIDYVSANVVDSVTSPLGTILVNGSEIESTNYAINLTGVRTPYTTATTVNIAQDAEFYPLNFGTINTGSFLNISGFGGNTGSFYIVGNDSANNVITLQFDNQSGSLGKIVSGIYAILDRGATGNYNFELSSYTLGSGVDELAWKSEINNLPTKEYLETNYQPQSAMTAYQPQNEMWRYLTTEDAFYTYQLKNDMSGYYTTADANTLSSMFSGAIDYISANAGDQEVSNVVQSNSGTWNTVSDKLDSSAIDIKVGTSIDYVTAISGFRISAATAGNATYATRAGLDGNGNSFTTAYAKVSALNDYATESFVENVSGEITALIPDTSNFITNTSAEATYQTISGMTAYQPTGAYITLDDYNYGVI